MQLCKALHGGSSKTINGIAATVKICTTAKNGITKTLSYTSSPESGD